MSDNALTVAVPAAYRDWRSVASLAVDAVSSAHSKRAYSKALKDFLAWHAAEARPPISRTIVQQYRSVLESAGLASPSINLRLSAIRKLAAEAAKNGLLDRSVAQGIVSLKGVRHSGDRAGNWLAREQARDLLAQPQIETTEGKRDRAILAVLLGCTLRRSELAALDSRHILQRDGRWVFVDLVEARAAASSNDLSRATRSRDVIALGLQRYLIFLTFTRVKYKRWTEARDARARWAAYAGVNDPIGAFVQEAVS